MASPQRDLDLRTICNELRTVRWKWFQLGIHLGIPRFKLIEFQEDPDPLSAVVDFWLRGNVVVPIAWQSIVAALKDISELGLAEKINTQYRRDYQKSTLVSVCCSLVCWYFLLILAIVVIIVCAVFLLSRSQISTYSAHLKKIYANKDSSGGKWPAIPVNSYVNLAIAWHTPRDIDEISKHVLHGNVKEMLVSKESIQLESIFESRKSREVKRNLSLLLVEGAPGIGKSTLTWELCRRWRNGDLFMKHFSLVVLHRLREKSTQQINNVRDLFPHEDKNLQQLVSDEVIASEGKGVLFILDGFDEFQHKANHDNFLIKLITGKVLPDSTVLVTTRPAATATLLTHRPHVDQRIEILGFTQEQVKEFASDAFSDYEPEVLDNFMKYIEASKNPAINSLMYIPLNAAIIAEIYRRNYKDGLPVPKTLTQLYTELCLTLLRRFLAANASAQNIILDKIEDLSHYKNYYNHFKNLSRVAFEEFRKENAIIYTLPRNLEHFGLLDSVQALHGGGQVSYNFLHLTIQEFLAAYHISHHDISMQQVFYKYGRDKRWELVWRFVAGFTKLEYFINDKLHQVFINKYYYDDDSIEVNMFFFLCIFEAQVDRGFNFKNLYEEAKTFQVIAMNRWPFNNLSPMDMYVLGYFLANSAPTVSWEIQLEGNNLETFVWGLKSAKGCENGIIHKLRLIDASETHLNYFPEGILHGISHLSLMKSDLSALGKAIIHLKNLKSLTISIKNMIDENTRRDLSYIYQQLLRHNINIEELDLRGVPFFSHELEFHDLLKSLKSLHLSIDVCRHKTLYNMIFSSTSLETLSIACRRSETYFPLLETNNNLKNLTLGFFNIPSPDLFKTTLEHNTHLQYLNLEMTDKVAMENCNNLKLITEAIQHSTLARLSITISGRYDKLEEDYADLITDYRIAILPIRSYYRL